MGLSALLRPCAGTGSGDMGRGLVHGGGGAVSWSSEDEGRETMVKRICPACGASNYSSDTLGVWTCHGCKTQIESGNESAEDYLDKEKG